MVKIFCDYFSLTCFFVLYYDSNRVVPKGKYPKTYNAFMDLPKTDWCCTAVDVKEGQWVDCFCGTRVYVRNDERTFTLEKYIAHCKENSQHRKAVAHHEESARLEAKRKEKGDDALSSLERKQLAAKSKKATRIDFFMAAKTKKSSTEP